MKYVMAFLTLLLVYLFLAGFTIEEVILGSLVSAVITALLARKLNFKVGWNFPYKLLKFLFIYLPVFIWKLILANIDVARRVLSFKIPLNPGIVKVKTHIKSDIGKLTLANSITLTPGTLSIDVKDDYIYVHTIDMGKNQVDSDLSKPFEKILGGIFEWRVG